MASRLSIGQVAKASGVATKTIRCLETTNAPVRRRRHEARPFGSAQET